MTLQRGTDLGLRPSRGPSRSTGSIQESRGVASPSPRARVPEGGGVPASLRSVGDGFERLLHRAAGALQDALRQVAPESLLRAASTRTAEVTPGAWRVQKELSETRQALGAVIEKRVSLEGRADDGVLAGANTDALKRLAVEEKSLRGALGMLEAAEAAQPEAEVERARFEVFQERFSELERARGPEVSARLARQTWYNDRKFNVAAGTTPASEAALLMAGFPESPNMQSPAGERIDMGHVACALDWQVNPSPTHNLLVDLEEVTLTGDLAAAAQVVADGGLSPEEALAQQAGKPDLLGDVDGLNLAARLRAQPRASVGDVLREYYAGADTRRMDELASHSRFFQRDARGEPVRDAKGKPRLEPGVIERATGEFAAKLLAIDYGGNSGSADRLDEATRAVVSAWAEQSGVAAAV